MTYEEIKEEFAYSVISLLCDIGGTLGLLLGASGTCYYLNYLFSKKKKCAVNRVVNYFQISMRIFFSFDDGAIYGELS